MWWSINGRLYPNVPMYVVREGDVVVMHIENRSGEVHPMHLHGHHEVVLARNGVAATGSPWWVDSLNVLPRRDLRHRLRGQQPRHLDGPLPQPQARCAGHDRAPDVRGVRHPVPDRWTRGQPARVSPLLPKEHHHGRQRRLAVCDLEPIVVDQPADAFQNRGLRIEGGWVRRAGVAAQRRGYRAEGYWPLGHHVHPDPVVGAG